MKQLLQVARLHYEKILLSLALVGLAVAVWILYQASVAEEQKIETTVTDYTGRAVQGVDPVNLVEFQQALEAAKTPPTLTLAPPHNLLNPVKWQKKPDGTFIKIRTGEEIGVGQLVVTNLTPLYYRITLDRIIGPGSYYMGIQNKGATNLSLQAKFPKYVTTTDNRKNETFTLLEAKGPPDNPELTLELAATQERVTVTKDQPYQRVESYEADLKYMIDGQTFKARRVNDVVRFGGEEYKIVAINEGEVVLSALLNNKKHSIKYSAGRQ
jgi:hypothetical protein